jgi:DNA-binding transcriptional MerR regulator
MSTYRISQLAERCGVPATTLRFYEDAGLLSAERTPAGYRLYGEDAIERLGFISSAKLLGLALEEIRELLDVREEGVCASVRARMVPLVAGRIAETEGRIAELLAFSAHLAAVHGELSSPAPEGECGPDCGCTTAPVAAGPVAVTLSPIRPAPAVEPTARPAQRHRHGIRTRLALGPCPGGGGGRRRRGRLGAASPTPGSRLRQRGGSGRPRPAGRRHRPEGEHMH